MEFGLPSPYMNRFGKDKQKKLETYKDLEFLAYEMNLMIDAVVVEGIHDKITLESLGLKMPIILVSSGPPITQIVEKVTQRFDRVAILTDFDEEGERIGRRLTELMEHEGVKVDRFYRKAFRRLMRGVELTTLESIYKLKKDLFH